jgi:hypothetical protein
LRRPALPERSKALFPFTTPSTYYPDFSNNALRFIIFIAADDGYKLHFMDKQTRLSPPQTETRR